MSRCSRPDLDRALGFELSDQQWEVVSAPLEPAVAIARAGGDVRGERARPEFRLEGA